MLYNIAYAVVSISLIVVCLTFLLAAIDIKPKKTSKSPLMKARQV